MKPHKYDDIMQSLHASPIGGGAYLGLSEAELSAIERQLGHKLPDDYKQFLQKYGLCSGQGDIRFRNMDDPSEIETSVGVFYGVQPDDTYDLLRKKSLFGERLPTHILPIASSPGGHICLSLSGQDEGRVYWWSPNRGSINPYDDLELIASSFDSFIRSLILMPDEE